MNAIDGVAGYAAWAGKRKTTTKLNPSPTISIRESCCCEMTSLFAVVVSLKFANFYISNLV